MITHYTFGLLAWLSVGVTALFAPSQKNTKKRAIKVASAKYKKKKAKKKKGPKCLVYSPKRCMKHCLKYRGKGKRRRCVRRAKKVCFRSCLKYAKTKKKKLSKTTLFLPKDPKVAKAVKGIQKFYKGMKTFRANFEQVYKRKGFSRMMKEKGLFFFKKPAMMRFRYQSPEQKEIIFGGSTLWMYNVEDNEVRIRKKVKRYQLGVIFQFLWGSGDLNKTFRITKCKKFSVGKKSDICLELDPRKPQRLFKKIYFKVIPGSYLIRETIYRDPAGNLNRFIFKKMKTNTKIPRRAFFFKIPKGTTVIELR